MTPPPSSLTHTSVNLPSILSLPIEVQNLGFYYHPDTPILREITFHINPGECVLVIGENGSGKSTLFQCLANLVSRNTGDIHIGNWVVSEKNSRKILEHIGFLFQNSEDQLFLPTVEEELTFGLFNLGKTNEEILACITETTHIFGIEELLERKIFHLSQGEKRKVAMAAIYAMNPDIYLLDEPFNNLDPKTRSELREVLNHLHENGKTLLLISHELENIPPCFTRVLVLHQGSLIFDGQLRTLYEKTDILTQVNFEIPSISRIYRRLCQNPLIKERFTNILPPITEEDFIKLLERLTNH